MIKTIGVAQLAFLSFEYFQNFNVLPKMQPARIAAV